MASFRITQIDKISSVRFVPDWVIRFGVALLLIVIPLYPKFPLVTVPGTYVSVRLEDWLIAILVVFWLISRADKVLFWLLQRPARYLVYYWMAGALVVLSALWITHTGRPMLVLLHFFRRIEYMILFIIAWSSVQHLKQLSYYLMAIWLGLLGVVFYGVGQKLWSFPIISTMNKEYSQGVAQVIAPGARINSTFAGHYDLAAYAVMMLNFWLVWWFISSSKTGKLMALIAWVGSFWLLLASASRISFAAYLGSLVITLLLARRYRWIAPLLTISLLASTLAPSLLTRYSESFRYEITPRLISLRQRLWRPTATPTPIPSPTITSTPAIAPTVSVPVRTGPVVETPPLPIVIPTSIVTSTPTITPTPHLATVSADLQPEYVSLPEDRSTAIRFQVEWPRALRAFFKNPLLGTGFSSITLATDNDYLRALGESGLAGLVGFLLVITGIVRILFQHWRRLTNWRQLYLSGILGLMAGFLANALFIDVFEASKVASYFWLLTGISMAVVSLSRAQPPS